MAAIARAHRHDMDRAALAPIGDAAVPAVAGAPPRRAALAPPRRSQPPSRRRGADRDDRGPAPLPEPRDYDAPSRAARCRSMTPRRWRRASRHAPPSRPRPTRIRRGHRIRRAPAGSGAAARAPIALAAARLATAILLLIAHQYRPDRLARRRRAVPAADRLALCGDRPAGEPARTRLHRTVTRKETQDGVQVLVVEGVIKSQSRAPPRCRGCALPCATAAGHEIYSWTALPRATRSPPAPPCRSARGSPRRRPRRMRCWCASSTGAIWSPELQ